MSEFKRERRRERRAKRSGNCESDTFQSIPESVISKINFALKQMTPKTQTQSEFFHEFNTTTNHIILSGYAGVGKTACALHSGLSSLHDNQYRKITIVRSAVPTRDQGFMPGNETEKSAVYEMPYKQLVNKFYGRDDAYGILKKHGIIEFITTSFVRGITLEGSVVICDEFNNFTAHELDSVVTRLGDGCRLLLCGDYLQTDFTKSSDRNVHLVIKILSKMQGVTEISFGANDIVRSGLVKNYIKAKTSLYPNGY